MDREQRERLASKSQLCFNSLDLLSDEYQLLFSLARRINGKDKARGAPGISGIELAFSLLFPRLVKPGVIPLSRLSRHLSLAPARILGLNKGLVKEGLDGDLVLIEDGKFTVTEDFFFSKSSNTPLLGSQLWGKVWATVHRGEVIYIDGKAKGRDFHDYRQVV